MWCHVKSQAGITRWSATSRMRWFCESATTMAPLEGITATPKGKLKPAAAPVPSSDEVPLPASVVTPPPGYVTSLMRLLPESPTTLTPLEGITAMPNGKS